MPPDLIANDIVGLSRTGSGDGTRCLSDICANHNISFSSFQGEKGFGDGMDYAYFKRLFLIRSQGILSSSGPLGTLIFTSRLIFLRPLAPSELNSIVLLNQLIHYGPGFQWAVRAAAFFSLGCLVLGNILISVPSRRAQSLIEPPQTQNKAILKNIPYTLTILSGFVAQLGTFFPLFYIQLFAVEHSISNSLAFYSLAIMNGAGIVGRSLPGYVADKWGSIEVWFICEALSGKSCSSIHCIVTYRTIGALCFAMLGSDSVVGLVLFCIL